MVLKYQLSWMSLNMMLNVALASVARQGCGLTKVINQTRFSRNNPRIQAKAKLSSSRQFTSRNHVKQKRKYETLAPVAILFQ